VVPTPSERATLKPEEAFALIGLSRASGYKALKRGEIPSIRLGSKLLVPTAELRDMLGLERDPQPVA